MRWDDQERIREKIPGGGKAASKDEVDGVSASSNSEYEIVCKIRSCKVSEM